MFKRWRWIQQVLNHLVGENYRINRGLEKILYLLEKILQREEEMSLELDNLTVQVAKNVEDEGSAITLIQGLVAQIQTLIAEIAAQKEDPVKIQALTDALKTSADSLAAVITANTPAP